MGEIIISIENVSMMFHISSQKVDSLKEFMIQLVRRRLQYTEFWALQDISLQVKKGEALGIVGLNGSGKSTLLKIIAGIMKPTTGNVTVQGSIAPLIELGAGFDPDLSARENVFLNGAVLGYQRAALKDQFNEIIDFAELWEFLDTPIKNYSSGMVARLGFSIATICRPDILIVDEILGVGDYRFQVKCEKRMNDIINGGTTVIFVSHNPDQIQRICKKIVWLERGKTIEYGPTLQVMEHYMGFTRRQEV